MIRPTVYKILGTISVIFTYIGKKNKRFVNLKIKFSSYFLVPFISLFILNILIVCRLRERQHTSMQRSMATSSSTKTDSKKDSASTRKRQRQKNTDRNITFMLIAVAIAFMVMSFPYQ